MVKRRLHEISITDKTTGQVLDFVYKPPGGIGGKWVRVFQDGMARLIRDNPKLRGESLRVLTCLLATAGWKNSIPSPSVFAKTSELQPTNVYRAYRELKGAGAILEIEDACYLSPRLCWKGTEAQLEKAYLTTFRGLPGDLPYPLNMLDGTVELIDPETGETLGHRRYARNLAERLSTGPGSRLLDPVVRPSGE